MGRGKKGARVKRRESGEEKKRVKRKRVSVSMTTTERASEGVWMRGRQKGKNPCGTQKKTDTATSLTVPLPRSPLSLSLQSFFTCLFIPLPTFFLFSCCSFPFLSAPPVLSNLRFLSPPFRHPLFPSSLCLCRPEIMKKKSAQLNLRSLRRLFFFLGTKPVFENWAISKR